MTFISDNLKTFEKCLKPYMSTKDYYNILPILNRKCYYNMSYGEKSNGKSTAWEMVGCVLNAKFDKNMVLVRQHDIHFRKGNAERMFDGVPKQFIIDITGGAYDHIVYYRYAWYFAKEEYNKQGEIEYKKKDKPIAIRQAVSDKVSSVQFPDTELIFFDEFITRAGNYENEFVDFQTLVSTIVRKRDTVTIAMAGNTINKYSIYFIEYGLDNVPTQKQGTIDIYEYEFKDSDTGENKKLNFAVEYCDNVSGKKSNIYQSFKNSKLQMITTGEWAIPVYPHLPVKYLPKHVLFKYYILFDKKQPLQCDIVSIDGQIFTYIKREIESTINFDTDIIYIPKVDSRPNISPKINNPIFDFQKKIWWFFVSFKVFYQDNGVGEVVNQYLAWCDTMKIKKA